MAYPVLSATLACACLLLLIIYTRPHSDRAPWYCGGHTAALVPRTVRRILPSLVARAPRSSLTTLLNRITSYVAHSTASRSFPRSWYPLPVPLRCVAPVLYVSYDPKCHYSHSRQHTVGWPHGSTWHCSRRAHTTPLDPIGQSSDGLPLTQTSTPLAGSMELSETLVCGSGAGGGRGGFGLEALLLERVARGLVSGGVSRDDGPVALR